MIDYTKSQNLKDNNKMTLYYIRLGLNYRDYITTDNELRFEFQKKTSFIDDYFSKNIR